MEPGFNAGTTEIFDAQPIISNPQILTTQLTQSRKAILLEWLFLLPFA